jgi:hypothetical protein
MSEYYDIDRANARLPELRQQLEALRSMRLEVIALRDRIIELNAPQLVPGAVAPAASAGPNGDEETQRLRLRMQGIVDQMQGGVVRIDGWHIQLRDIPTGLVDFPALANGRPIWLCWRLGESAIDWWHEMSEGFEGRQRFEDLV